MRSTGKSIGFVCGGRSWGGLEMNVLRIARWLGQEGLNIYLFADKESPLFEQAIGYGLRCHHFQSNFKYGDLLNASRLAKLASHCQVDTIILHTNREMFVCVLARLLSGKHLRLIYQQHMHVGGSKKDLFHRWEYCQLDAWIAPLPMYAKRVGEYTAVNPERIHVIPFGIEMASFIDRQPDKQASRRKLELPRDAFIVGVVGRLDPKKGQDTLIDAIALLHQQNIPVHALLVGDRTKGEWESFENQLHQLVKEHHLNDFVHFRPYSNDVASAYAALDTFALTSHSETYGMVTVEAMASGLPVIGTSDGGTLEIIEHERTGLLVPARNANALAKAIKRVFQDSDFREEIARSARADAFTRFSHTSQVVSLVQLIGSQEH